MFDSHSFAAIYSWSRSLASLFEISHDDITRIVCKLTYTSKEVAGKGTISVWVS